MHLVHRRGEPVRRRKVLRLGHKTAGHGILEVHAAEGVVRVSGNAGVREGHVGLRLETVCAAAVEARIRIDPGVRPHAGVNRSVGGAIVAGGPEPQRSRLHRAAELELIFGRRTQRGHADADFADPAGETGAARQHALDRRWHEEVIVGGVHYGPALRSIRNIHARADVGVQHHERVAIDAQADIGGDAAVKLNGVLRERAHLATARAIVERDPLVFDVHVRQPEHVRQIAVARVVVAETLVGPKTDNVQANLHRLPAGESRHVRLRTHRLQLTVGGGTGGQWPIGGE